LNISYFDDFRISSNGSNSITGTLEVSINVPIQGKQGCVTRLVCQMFANDLWANKWR
jgi:hypothetical protein